MRRQANLEKRKFQIVLRDPHEVPHRKGINSIVVPDLNGMGASKEFIETNSTILFTGSRDRLIKLWQVNPNSKK